MIAILTTPEVDAEPATEVPPVGPPRRPLPFEVALIVRVLAVLSLLCLGFVGYLLLLSPIQQDRAQGVLYAKARESLADVTMPIGGTIEPGSPVAVLDIPGLRLTQVVVEGTTGTQLQLGPGHRRTSPLPGQPGVSVLMGRAATFGAPFREITKLHEGDEITVTTGQGRFSFRVDGVRREGDRTVPLPAGGSRIVLVSVEGGGALDLGIGPDRTVFVDATLTGQAASAGVVPTAALPEEAPLRADPAGLLPLVLWLQAALLAVIGFVWARLRWGRWETWLVGMPVLLAVAWQVYTAVAAAALPNLL
ncbi:sortase [Solihabitans fulvus]|uniref:Sortase n=1 Tax=Solihabitans fulvus TaxID=1892852 RepID=A0A5B2WXM4_9PSEU|nr:sortase [Solihabitans fulvus]KAA2255650.1 sortase [Solihabitans fulvus]